MSHFKDTVYSKAPFSVRVVEFDCLNCGRRWSCANGSLEDYQKCNNFYAECYPVGSRIREPTRFGNENRQTLQGHNKDICGKCARLGRSCMMLSNESDNDTDDVDTYMKIIPQARQLNSRGYHQDEDRPVTGNYSPKQSPELTTLALRYLPEPYAPNYSNRIRLATTSNDITSLGMTVAETLKNVIHSAQEKAANEPWDGTFIYEDCNEEEDEDKNQRDTNTLNEIWDYEASVFNQDECDDYDELHYNSVLNRLDDELDFSSDNDEEEESNENKIVAFDDSNDIEPYFYQDDQNYSLSRDEEACFDDIDNLSSDDDLYKKQIRNRLLRRGRRHVLQGRKNSLKLIVG
ncbi:uncharacterized protein ATC70_005453 [Mucor velutinosus]|uniref:Uncharacterized protein n=1 Tax=Mucor velutinosus TaxID=708070 RepID=A0AAN7D9P7_9FUNG|nr:hypothetical protein ATC70_005453 [Mucor velutinosus]